jgi:hypothetical protein
MLTVGVVRVVVQCTSVSVWQKCTVQGKLRFTVDFPIHLPRETIFCIVRTPERKPVCASLNRRHETRMTLPPRSGKRETLDTEMQQNGKHATALKQQQWQPPPQTAASRSAYLRLQIFRFNVRKHVSSLLLLSLSLPLLLPCPCPCLCMSLCMCPCSCPSLCCNSRLDPSGEAGARSRSVILMVREEGNGGE